MGNTSHSPEQLADAQEKHSEQPKKQNFDNYTRSQKLTFLKNQIRSLIKYTCRVLPNNYLAYILTVMVNE